MSNLLKVAPSIQDFESFGAAIDAAGFAGLVPRLMDALEAGEVGAAAQRKPCATEHLGNKTLKDAGSPTPSWWRDYRTFCEPSTTIPHTWVQWLRSQIRLNHVQVLSIFQDSFEQTREKYRDYPKQAGDKAVWSHKEMLAWLATGDDDLIGSLRDFAPKLSDRILEIQLRNQALRYLRFQIACHHCRCGSVRPLLPRKSSEICQCSQKSWNLLLENISQENFDLQFNFDSGLSKKLSPLDVLMIEANFDSGKIFLNEESGQLITRKSTFLSAAKRWKGVPPPFTCDEIKTWIEKHTQYSDHKTARAAFMKEDRAKGLSATFETTWREVNPAERGRPRKPR